MVKELFGDEHSLGLSIDNRIVTRIKLSQSKELGWLVGDCILGVGDQVAGTQEALLAIIAEAKSVLRREGTPIRFVVQRMGERPGPKLASLVFIDGRSARVKELDVSPGQMLVEFTEDGSVACVDIGPGIK